MSETAALALTWAVVAALFCLMPLLPVLGEWIDDFARRRIEARQERKQ